MIPNSSETTQERQRVGRASEADEYLAAAVEEVKLRPDSYTSYNGYPVHPSRVEVDPVRQLLVLAGVGQAVLALGETLDGRLADVADAVTDVRTQVGELSDAVQASRRGWWRRGAARPALAAADMTVICRALADAAEWRQREDRAGVGDERIAFEYLALRDRLGGGAS